MARLGKVYGNLIVDINATNEKLVDRARRIVAEAADTDLDTAARALAAAHGHAKTAIMLLLANSTAEEAAARRAPPTTTSGLPSRPDPPGSLDRRMTRSTSAPSVTDGALRGVSRTVCRRPGGPRPRRRRWWPARSGGTVRWQVGEVAMTTMSTSPSIIVCSTVSHGARMIPVNR